MEEQSFENLLSSYQRLHEDYAYLEKAYAALQKELTESQIYLWRTQLESEQLRQQLLSCEKDSESKKDSL